MCCPPIVVTFNLLSSCWTILLLILFQFRYICITFSLLNSFLSLATNSNQKYEIPDRKKTKQNIRKHIRKKGHADCHTYRTLDPRRPVYDELSIHPPPRRVAPVPGEEVNQSGASLYAGKIFHTLPCLPRVIFLPGLRLFSI